MEISRRFQIEAAHWLPNAPGGHKCRRLHGHSFVIEITVVGEPDGERGWVLDFADIDAAFSSLHERLDHRYLNDIEGLENPTSENLAIWVWQELDGGLAGLDAVEVEETCRSSVRYRGPKEGDRR